MAGRRGGRTAKSGVVVETKGRRVLVRDDEGERICFLSGCRAVVGDRVVWVPARGSGGKLTSVESRDSVLRRMDLRGREQILVANLRGLIVVMSVNEPGFRPALLHRYLVTAHREGLDVLVVLSKVDLGVSDTVNAHVEMLEGFGIRSLRVSVDSGAGLGTLREFLGSSDQGGAWALVGSSGVGKTSLIGALLPDVDVGPVGEISDYWGTGRHTTTHSRWFELPSGGTLVDSPGIRNFTPVVQSPIELRDHFVGVRDLRCQYRDCLHRPGEEGCVAPEELPEELLNSYRDLSEEVRGVCDRLRP